jgi:hypothetical protein
MASALSALTNAEVVLTVPASGNATVTDPATGNVRPATTTLTVSLYAKARSSDATVYPGVDAAQVAFDAVAVSPMALDARITRGVTGTLTFDGGTWSVEVEGVREPYGATGLIGSTLRSVVGDRLTLVARGQW